jgi:hypothetical protein
MRRATLTNNESGSHWGLQRVNEAGKPVRNAMMSGLMVDDILAVHGLVVTRGLFRLDGRSPPVDDNKTYIHRVAPLRGMGRYSKRGDIGYNTREMVSRIVLPVSLCVQSHCLSEGVECLAEVTDAGGFVVEKNCQTYGRNRKVGQRTVGHQTSWRL